ncbi:restriction endonuclease subunit S [Flavobacterium psychrophilum]
MQISKYLTFVPFAKFNLWDTKRYTSKLISSTFPIVSLDSCIVEQSKKYKIFEDLETDFGILGVNNKEGIFDAYTQKGKEINQPYKKMETGWLAYNPYRINVGSIGIKLKEHQNNYISPAYVVFSCKENLLPEFLFFLFKTTIFNTVINESTTGSVRQNLTFETLKGLQIPLPTIEEQKRIVSSYNAKLQLAQQQEQQAKTLETEIERYLFEELGVEKMIVKPFVKGVLNVFNFSEIFDRWDYNKGSSSVFSILHQSKYPVKTLDEAFNFTNRSWNKKAHQEKNFTYVEMGGIDAGLGIVDATNLEVSKAPSRATQTILKGDLIIGTTRPYLKKFAIVMEKNNENIASSAFQIIAPSEDYCLDYLLEYIKSEFGVKQFEYYMTGALYPAITSKDLRRVLIPFPPVEKQKQISGHMNSLKTKIKELNVLSATNKEVAIVEFEKEIFN